MIEEVKIISEGTPNPNALKFVLNKTLLESRSANFPNKDKADQSPLAKKLFEIKGVEEVFIGKDFITITKTTNDLWEEIYDKTIAIVSAYVESGEPILTSQAQEGNGSTLNSGNPIIDKIQSILDAQIRPALASDGGDVIFDSYEEGILRLHLQGACSSCPSSTMTLKHGIEQMLKREIPELKEVISL